MCANYGQMGDSTLKQIWQLIKSFEVGEQERKLKKVQVKKEETSGGVTGFSDQSETLHVSKKAKGGLIESGGMVLTRRDLHELVKHEFTKNTERKSILGLDKLAAAKREEEIRAKLELARKKLKGEESEWETSHIRSRTTSEQSGFTPTPDRRRREEEREREHRSERRSERGDVWDRSERRWYESSERRDRDRRYDSDRRRSYDSRDRSDRRDYSERRDSERRDSERRDSERRDLSRREGHSHGPETPRSDRATPRSYRGDRDEGRGRSNIEYTPASTPSWKQNEWMKKNTDRTPYDKR